MFDKPHFRSDFLTKQPRQQEFLKNTLIYLIIANLFIIRLFYGNFR
jgi:hypothetical protein